MNERMTIAEVRELVERLGDLAGEYHEAEDAEAIRGYADRVVAWLDGSFEVAWAEAEASSPEGWELSLVRGRRFYRGEWREGCWAKAGGVAAPGDTPAAALHALVREALPVVDAEYREPE